VEWRKGKKNDGSDSISVPILPPEHWPELRNVIAVINAGEKKLSSRVAMKQTVATSQLYQMRIHKIPELIKKMKATIVAKDFPTFAQLTMQESNNLHAVMLDTWPPIRYLSDVSYEVMEKIHELNDHVGERISAYTFDAGPNAHIYTTVSHVDKVVQALQCISGVKETLVCRIGGGPKFLENEQDFLIAPNNGEPRLR
jgi:diphosphomevalonate decarboxylase